MKILAIPNAHALAHVSRLLEIGKALRSRGHEIVFAGQGKYLEVANGDGFTTHNLPYVSVEQVIRAVRTQRLWQLYPEHQLEAFIEAEFALYEEVHPDLVLIDNRPTARTSAERMGFPTAAVLNVHMSTYREIPFFSLTNVRAIAQLPGVRALDRLEDRLERALYDRLVMGGLNRIRTRMGLRRLCAYEHEQGEITLLADVPEFSPARNLPSTAHYVGPLTWHNDLPPPRCIAALDPDRPTVYLSLGSEGLGDLLGHLDQAARQGLQIVVALGGAAAPADIAVPDGVFLEQFVNTDALLPRCDLVCCHGGNGTLYQALSFGLPIVVVATHQEQLYGGKRIQRLGLGRTLTLKDVAQAGFGLVVRTLQAVLQDRGFRERSQEFASHLRRWSGAASAADAIEQLLRSAGHHNLRSSLTTGRATKHEGRDMRHAPHVGTDLN